MENSKQTRITKYAGLNLPDGYSLENETPQRQKSKKKNKAKKGGGEERRVESKSTEYREGKK